MLEASLSKEKQDQKISFKGGLQVIANLVLLIIWAEWLSIKAAIILSSHSPKYHL
jgi:hypothetical protein